MSNLVYAEVPVGGTSILSLKDGDTVLVPLRNLCENLGLTWKNEHRKITSDPILGKAVIKMMTALSSGQEQLLMPLNYLPGWLFKINLNTVNEGSRPMLEAIQHEAYEALYSYWFRGAAINPRMSAPALTPLQDILRLVDAIPTEKNPAVREFKHRMLVAACAQRDIEPPALPDLSPTYIQEIEAERIMAAIDTLIAAKPDLNHHRLPNMIAVRRLDLLAHGIAPTTALRDHPRFRQFGPVNNREGRSVKCWVFWAKAE